MMGLSIGPTDAFIVVDLQYDFLPGGSLAVPDGDQVIAPINALAKCFRRSGGHVLLTQDWHPPGHRSFASNHEGREPFEQIEMPYGMQILWPDHCIMGTRGAEITRNLEAANAELVIRKGFNAEVDSYSAFREADRRKPTGLAGYLRERGFERVFCAGLATDFCVAWTAQDAKAAGFETFVVLDACRAIDTEGSLSRAMEVMERDGVRICSASDILAEA
jgi:nicotinamidase/pyrazinamidase